MTRKRFVKLLMSRRYNRNIAAIIALFAIGVGYTYNEMWLAVRIIDGDSELMGAVEALRNSIADILRIPRSMLYGDIQ